MRAAVVGLGIFRPISSGFAHELHRPVQESPMDALALLTADHQKLQSLFDQAQQLDATAERRVLFIRIREELELHAFIEQEIFYPAFGLFAEVPELVEEALEEHQ